MDNQKINLLTILTGGHLAGKRTYILTGIGILTAISQYLVGDIGILELAKQVPVILSAATVRAGVAQLK